MITRVTPNGRAYLDSSLPKVTRVLKLGIHDAGGVVGFFGLAELDGSHTITWMRDLADEHAKEGGSLRIAPFARRLLGALARPSTIRPEWLNEVLGFHIGKFEQFGRYKLPVFWFVRNCELTPDGRYVARGGWKADEQLLGRDFKDVTSGDVREVLQRIQTNSAIPHWYRNGDLPSFTAITDALKAAISFTARLPGYGPPEGLDAWCDLGKTFVYTSRNLARLMYRRGQVSIGGKADIERLSWPT
jgi:hypothetical protein